MRSAGSLLKSSAVSKCLQYMPQSFASTSLHYSLACMKSCSKTIDRWYELKRKSSTQAKDLELSCSLCTGKTGGIFTLNIPFTPKPMTSVRLSRSGWYNPRADLIARLQVKFSQMVASAGAKTPVFPGAVLMVVHYRFPMPQHWSKAKKLSQHGAPNIKRPDIDNLQKFLGDALRGALFKDDAQIIAIYSTKTLTQEKQGSYTIHLTELPLDCRLDPLLVQESLIPLMQVNP